jgi:RecA-family ATPase
MIDRPVGDPAAWSYGQAKEQVQAEAEIAAKRARPNGYDADWRELPAIDQADVARWRGLEPPEIIFTITELVPQGMVTLLTSVGGAGKTLLMQTACTVIAGGQQTFLGKGAVVGKAAGLFAEDPDGVLHLRQARINEFLGIGYDQIAGRLFLQSYFGLSAQLWREGQATRFMRELEDQLTQIDPLRLVTLDNLALLFSGDENSRSEVTEFLAALNDLADRLSIGIVLSAHASKSSDGTPLRVSSGSTAWVNACRSVLELKAGENDQGPSLTLVKANHAASGTTIQLAWQNGLLVPRAPPGGISGSIHQRTCERVFLELLDKVRAEGRHVSDSRNSGNYAPKLFAQRPDRKGFGKDDFNHAMEMLFSRNEITVAPYGRSGDKHREIVRAPSKSTAEKTP